MNILDLLQEQGIELKHPDPALLTKARNRFMEQLFWRAKVPEFWVQGNTSTVGWFNRLMVAIHEEGLPHLVRNEQGSAYKRTEGIEGYEITVGKGTIELFLAYDMGSCRIIHSWNYEVAGKKQKISGSESYRRFRALAGSLVDEYKVSTEEGLAAKEQIPSPRIEVAAGVLVGKSMIYPCAHHLDLNSAHISGMAEAAPKLRPAFEELYAKRKVQPINKQVLTHLWGYFQSKGCGYRLAPLSLAGMRWTNEHLKALEEVLRANDYVPLLFNTDGIWYAGKPEPYHGEGEGTALGQWKNDYVGCQLRIRSKGSYEFLEPDGTYHPVQRGATFLDRVKPRDQWEWGDIFSPLAAQLDMWLWNVNEEIYMEDPDGAKLINDEDL